VSESATVTCTRVVTVAAGVYAPGHLGELTQYLPFEAVDDVLEQTGTVQCRLRDLPSRVGVYFVLALALFPRLGYLRVWRKMVAGLSGLTGLAIPQPSEKALRDLRRRLGPAPLKMLFGLVAGPLALPGTPGVRFRGLRTVAFRDPDRRHRHRRPHPTPGPRADPSSPTPGQQGGATAGIRTHPPTACPRNHGQRPRSRLERRRARPKAASPGPQPADPAGRMDPTRVPDPHRRRHLRPGPRLPVAHRKTTLSLWPASPRTTRPIGASRIDTAGIHLTSRHCGAMAYGHP
jgi:hypothetical protein